MRYFPVSWFINDQLDNQCKFMPGYISKDELDPKSCKFKLSLPDIILKSYE